MSLSSNGRSALHRAAAWRPIYVPPLLLWTLSFVAGATLSLTGASLWWMLAAVVAVSAVTLASQATSGSARHERRAQGAQTAQTAAGNRWLNLVLVLMAPTLLAVGFWRAESTKFDAESLAVADLAGQTVRIEGVVRDDPVFHAGGVRMLVELDALRLGDERRTTDALVQLQVPDSPALRVGDRVAVRAALTSTAAGTGDYFQWLANRRVAAAGLAVPGSVMVVEHDQLAWWQRVAAEARSALNESLRDALPPPYSGIAQGMISGRRDSIDSDLRSTLNDTSLSHLIVISGSNLTLLTVIVMSAFGWLLGRRPAAALAILAALAYGALVGPDPPVQRAMWMAVVFATAHLLGRGTSGLYAVVATAGLMIGLEPHILLDISFQLTVAGTLGIVILMPSLAGDFLSGQRGIAGTIRDTALITMVASLATMPLIVLHFDRAALTGIPANLLAAPIFGWMLLGSAGTAIVGLVSESAASVLSWPLAWMPLRWLVIVAEQLALLPGAGASVQGFGHTHLLLIYGAIFLAALRPHRERVARWFRTPQTRRTRPTRQTQQPQQTRERTVAHPLRKIGLELIPDARSHITPAILTGIASAAAGAILLSACASAPDQLQVHFIDVGQGDAALIVTPEGRSILIDTGERPDAILSALRTHLPESADAIDVLVITHPQSDHGEALWAITDFYEIKQAYVNGHFQFTGIGRRIEAHLKDEGIGRSVLGAGDQIVIPGETPLYLDLLWPPDRVLPDHYLADPNATSLVIRARYDDAAFLFTGDINAEQELDLVRLPCPGSTHSTLPCELRADVLKVAHQGSRYSSTSLLLERVRPTVAVLSAGANNPHGHPHESVLASLERVSATSLLTAERGDISVATDGRSISITTER